MTYRRKATIATVVLFTALSIALWALGRMQAAAFSGQVSSSIKVTFFGSIIVGLAAGVSRIYWKQLEAKDNDGQRMAIETLSKLGQQKATEDKQAHDDNSN